MIPAAGQADPDEAPRIPRVFPGVMVPAVMFLAGTPPQPRDEKEDRHAMGS